jgi:hypothetical protein
VAVRQPYDADWNDAIQDAIREYHLHPTAACAATTACDDLARDGSRYCHRHRSNDPAARKRREEKK